MAFYALGDEKLEEIFKNILLLKKINYLKDRIKSIDKNYETGDTKIDNGLSYKQIAILHSIENKPLFELYDCRIALNVYSRLKQPRALQAAYNELDSVEKIKSVGDHSNAINIRLDDLNKILPHVATEKKKLVESLIEQLEIKKLDLIKKRY